MEFFVIVVLVIISLTLFRVIKSKNLPPGPTPFPIIGNLHFLGDQPHQSLAKLAKIHGPIMSLKLGQITTLVISSDSAAKEVLQKQDLDFSTRFVPDGLHAHHYAQHSVSFLPVGNQWRTLRRIINSNISSSKSLSIRKHLHNEKVKELVAYCQKASMTNDSVNIGRAAFRTSLNILSNTIFSKDLANPYEDSGKELKEVVENIMEEVGKPNLVDFFPLLKKFDPQGIRKRMNIHFGKVLEIFEELIKERLELGSLKQDDLLDVCLKISHDNPNELNRTHIKSLFIDMFVAGTDTTASTVEWAMTELLLYPYVMAKAKEELEKVIGKDNIVEEDDVARLPYLSCIVKETLRIHPPVPLLLPRKTENQVTLNGYDIPKGTQVLVNAWAIGRDPTIWDKPQEFKPERFLGSQMDVRGQNFELIPFGGGRRICPGMPLALHVIHMTIGSLLNNFEWHLDTRIQHNELDMSERFGITLQKAHSLYVVPRNVN